MCDSRQSVPAPQMVDGFPIPAMFSAEAYRSALSYKPQKGDLFLVSYPKCGTTWAQHILLLIFRQGEPMESAIEFFSATPFLEMTGAKGAEDMPRPGAIKIHLPFHLTPASSDAKYIYITRNPKDCCVSYFHHMRNMSGYKFEGDFDQFFEQFISGNIDYGDYFDHLMGWFDHRNDSNVLFITYEELKENPSEAILKMASFIDDEKYAEPLRNDAKKMENVLKFSSFNVMKERVNKNMDLLFSLTDSDVEKSSLPDEMKKFMIKMNEEKMSGSAPNQPPTSNFVRKGIIGDWKNYLTESQSQRMDKKFAERTMNTDLFHLWDKYL